jgi:hypothetical protein
MANYYATTRSNYFRVTDATAFEAWCRKRFLDFWTKQYEGIGLRYAVSGNETGWPYYDSDDDAEIDFTSELATHLDPRDVAVLIEIGSEKLRYLVGRATAVHHDGLTVDVDLEEIYERAGGFNGDLTVTEAGF